MICEACNEMDRFVSWVFDDTHYVIDEVIAPLVPLKIIGFLLTLFVLSWWVVPIRFIWNKTCDITFHCKKKEGE